MDDTRILPDIGSPVSSAAFDEDAIDAMSLGELAYAATVFQRAFSERMASPEAFHELATFHKASGADWTGHQASRTNKESEDGQEPAEKSSPVPPHPPENYYDTLQAISSMVQQQERAVDASMANLAANIEAALADQTSYLGVPAELSGFDNTKQVLRQTMRLSATKANKIIDRKYYFTHEAGNTADYGAGEPKFPKIAKAYAAGRIPTENLDRIMQLDSDLTKYSSLVGQTSEYKDLVLQAFEPTLVEAAEAISPEAMTKSKHRWAQRLAHAIDDDGPPLSEAFKKRPDNAIHDRAHTDGSGTIWMHMDPAWFASYKEFKTTNLNYKGNTPLLPEPITNLYQAAAEANKAANDDDASNTTDDAGTANGQEDEDANTATAKEATDGDSPTSTDQDDEDGDAQQQADADAARAEAGRQQAEAAFEDPTLTSDRQRVIAAFGDTGRHANAVDPDAPAHNGPTAPDDVIAEDANGHAWSAQDVDLLDHLSPGQRLGAILLGALYGVMSMDPKEAAAKRAHGSPAKLVIVQDIQTAHHTLGFPNLPEAVRRPPGAEGIQPTIVKRSNPDTPLDHPPDSAEETYPGYVNPETWTPYQSEAINTGPMHPKDTEVFLCDAEFVGQIWNGPDIVLNEYRSKRLFTTAQRKAILARDKGCQLPGCTVQATYCQIHHNQEWSDNGTTNEANANTLCPTHHTAIHDGNWTIRKQDGLTYFQPAPWLDPTQPLLRNLYWNT